MLLNISSSPISHRNPHFLSNFNNPISYFPRRSKTHLSKSHFFPKFTPLSNQSLKNRVLFGNKRYPDGERFDFRSRAISGIDLGSFESVLEAIAVLTTIIVVHESGHFLAASLQGIHVSKFAIGFGPILAKFDYNNVEYSLRAFPLGGFVGFPDNDPDSEIPIDDENLLKNRPTLDRSIVVSAGIIANVIFAYAIIFVQVLSVGLPVQEAFPGVLVPEVKTFSAASRDGLLSGDVILAVDGTELSKTGPDAVSKIVDIVKRNPKSNVVFRIERGGEDFDIRVTPDKNFDGTGKIGVQLSPNVRITKTASKVAGPVAIIAVGAEVARSNIDGLYQFAALLNINLAVINLLPLPALDGGTLALILLEAVRGGKKLPVEVEQGIMSSGIMLVIFLGLFLIVKDTLSLDFIKEML
ncbi:chloroplastic membrane metallo proteases [Arabidopsis thaliana]|uniref:Chloroplastic membrane metallo proteases n=1 Tax=Arabidopsis thaliana TaxID=3702 RepID=F4ITR5_ARATH|nr:chloroplastic membrane metallo proteases [Arabidopsis thaliana]AEC08692.1 chloroplastic membrane metallo proteases [Arabidopsis thaliana]|eukprot:NP_973582.1 chloroplastic membrane metallo proteases [Arabidopsis thaliana]